MTVKLKKKKFTQWNFGRILDTIFDEENTSSQNMTSGQNNNKKFSY